MTCGIVHWDGKLLPEITGNEKVERLPIIVAQMDGDQLLGVPQLPNSTGLEISEAIFEVLTDWDIKNNIVGACSDTTSAKTGRLNGAAVLLEQKLYRDLLYLACRHHIYENFLSATFDSEFGPTSGKNVPLFERFQKSWNNLNKNNFKSGMEDNIINDYLVNVSEEIIHFCTTEMQLKFDRDECKELLELTLIFLGVNAGSDATFRTPGPMHYAIFMSKALYCLKIYLFRSEFKLTKKEKKNN